MHTRTYVRHAMCIHSHICFILTKVLFVRNWSVVRQPLKRLVEVERLVNYSNFTISVVFCKTAVVVLLQMLAYLLHQLLAELP